MEGAKQMAFLVKAGNDAVHPETHQAAREALSSRIKIEAAKQFAKNRAGRAKRGGRKGERSGGARSDSGSKYCFRERGPSGRLLKGSYCGN